MNTLTDELKIDFARYIYRQGYFPIRWEGNILTCFSLAPDSSSSELKKYRFIVRKDYTYERY